MKKRSTVIVCIVAALILVSYAGYNLYLKMTSIIDTEYASEITEYKTEETDCFIIRDEVIGNAKNNKALIRNSGSGVYTPYVEDGSRVGSGETIALFFPSQSEAKMYLEKSEIEKKLEFYKELQSQSKLSFLDIDSIDLAINDRITELLECVEKNDLSLADESIEPLRHNITSRQIATGEDVDLSSQISALEEQLKSVSAAGANYKRIKTAYSGYFISNVDGYESAASWDDVKKLDCGDIEKLIETEPSVVGNDVIGKIVYGFNWYAVCVLPHNSLGALKTGSTVKVGFKNTPVKNLEMTVHSISEAIDDKCAVVLKGNLMNKDIAALRKEKIQIITETYSGLKVPEQALRRVETETEDDDGKKETEKVLGVYVLYGQVVRFRRIDILQSCGDYVVADVSEKSKGEIALNDMIITKGRNLYDGKVVY